MTRKPKNTVDHERLLSELERADPEAIGRAYRQVFGSPIGRWVLTHQLAEAGVGQWRDHTMDGMQRAALDGEARHALRILDLAGYGPLSAAHLIAANALEGQDHDQFARPDARAEPGAFSGADAGAVTDPG